ncbi:PDZ domain-containing protein, partial [Roseomonas genomospecies 6]
MVARAPNHDLALLLVDGSLPPPAPRKTAAALRSGEAVLAIGNPFGRGLSIASGNVSGFDRDVITAPERRLTGMIETTTPLSPGNSGGPLLTCRGEVVGINTAAIEPGPNGARLGFAIPIDQAVPVVDRMLQVSSSLVAAAPSDTHTERPGLGLYVVPSGARALLIQSVVPGSPAARAGAMPGDAIIGANGRVVSSPADLQSLVQKAGNGTVAILRIVRSGAQLDMAVQISSIVFAS